MAIFGRGFPSKSFAFGAIAAPPVVDMSIEETIDNVGVNTQTLTSAEAQAAGNSGDSSQALAVEATSEAEVNTATGAQSFAVDAIGEAVLGSVIINQYADSFNRANETPLVAGPWYTQYGGNTIDLVGNRLEANADGDKLYYYADAATTADHWSEVRITAFNADAGPAVRVGSEGAGQLSAYITNCYDGSLDLGKFVSGVYTHLANIYETPQAGDLIRLWAIGNQLHVYVNGVPRGSPVTDNSLSAKGQGAGVFIYPDGGGGHTLDDWSGGDAVAAGNAQGIQTITEVHTETPQNSADSTQSILSAEAESGGSSGGGSQSTSEATAESVLGSEILIGHEESDDFNRSNETPLASPWFNSAIAYDVTGTPNLVSNVARSSSGFSGSYYTGAATSNDQYSEVYALGRDSFAGVRMAVGTTAFDGYAFGCYGGIAAIWKIANGYTTLIANTGSTGVTNTPHTYRLEIEGTTLTAYIDGVAEGITPTDSSYATGQVGMWPQGASGHDVDSWEGGDLNAVLDNAENIQEIDELVAVVDTLTNTGTATIVITDAQSEAEVSTGTGAPAIAEATSESVLGSEIEPLEYSDDFNRSDGPLTAPWVQAGGDTMVILDNEITWDSDTFDTYAYYDAEVSDDQFAEVTLTFNAFGGSSGPAVRMSGEWGTDLKAYFMAGHTVGNIGLWSYIFGSGYNNISQAGVENNRQEGDVIRLEIEGTTLRSYTNGVEDPFSPYTDANISTGKPGVRHYYGHMDDWSGGNIEVRNAENIQEISDYSVDAQGNTGTGSQSATDATAESPQNVGGPLDYGEGPYGGGPYGVGEPHTMAEALAETVTNSATNTPAISEEIPGEGGDTLVNTGTATHAINEADAESADDDSSNNQALAEATAESVLGTEIAYPSTGLLDNFNRADSTNLGSAWTEITTNFVIASNKLGKASGSNGVAYWNAAKYTDVEMWSTVAGVASGTVNYWWRLANETNRAIDPTTTGNLSGYNCNITASTDTIIVNVDDGTTSTELASLSVPGLTSGDAIGIRMIGNTISVWRQPGATGSWIKIGSDIVDNTFSDAGRIAFQNATQFGTHDNFGGGVAVPVGNAQNIQETGEATAETPLNSATATILISDFQTEQEVNTGTGAQTITEALAEGISNTGTGTPAIEDEATEPSMVNVGTSTQSLAEAIVEPNVNNSATGTQSLGVDATAETESNGGTGTHELSDYELDTTTNVGTGTPSQAEAVAETDTVEFLASHFIDDDITIRVVPFSDISTGTWTVTPLYPKVDEIIALGGYPTESIRSGNNPNNDVAVMGLTPASDPGINNNHYINVEFFKEGDEVVDLIVKLKEGATVIATRTFSNVTETEEAPRQERIALTELEASAIVDYANLNIELVADQA